MSLQDLLRRKDRNIVLGEINAGFEHRDQLHQFLFDGLQAAGERAFQLLGCDLGLIERLRLDQIADRLRLGEIDASVEKRAHGELARLGEAGAAGQGQLDHVAQNHRRAVGRDFDDVVGGVGVRLGKVGDHDFVDALFVTVWSRATRPRAVFPWKEPGGPRWRLRGRVARDTWRSRWITWFDKLSEHRSAGFEFMLQAQHGSSNARAPPDRRGGPRQSRRGRVAWRWRRWCRQGSQGDCKSGESSSFKPRLPQILPALPGLDAAIPKTHPRTSLPRHRATITVNNQGRVLR